MKKMNFKQMEVINGGQTQTVNSAIDYDQVDGMTWTVAQHFWCGVSGFIAGGGVGGAFTYLVCLQLVLL
jgi:hypothetical protein